MASRDRVDSMSPVARQHITTPRPSSKPIFEHKATHKHNRNGAKFDPSKHIAYTPPKSIVTMGDIGFPDDTGVSPVAVSMPFQLFSPDAIQQMRSEIFQPEVMENCSVSSNIAACQLRGYASKYAPFTLAAWNHPDTLSIISKIAGVDLVPWSDYEVAHINLSFKTDDQANVELEDFRRQRDGDVTGRPVQDDTPIVGWHRDSYPFVCVLMMSDCTNMVGGETALRTANGGVLKVRGPQEGCAVILQGRYITHQALRALGATERITAVTSFRPRSPLLKDDTVLTTVRPISNLSELYSDFAEYRLGIMEERCRKQREELVAQRRAGKKFDTLGHKKFLEESIDFMEHTNHELVEESKVVPGFVEEEADTPNVVVSSRL